MSSKWFHWKDISLPPSQGCAHGWFYCQKDKCSWNLLGITWDFLHESDKKNGWVTELSGSHCCRRNGGRRTATCFKWQHHRTSWPLKGTRQHISVDAESASLATNRHHLFETFVTSVCRDTSEHGPRYLRLPCFCGDKRICLILRN